TDRNLQKISSKITAGFRPPSRPKTRFGARTRRTDAQRCTSTPNINPDRGMLSRARPMKVTTMKTFDRYSTAQEQKFPLGYVMMATFIAVVTLALFAREPAGAPAPQRQVVVQTTPEPLVFEITPSPVMGFGPAEMATGDGGQ